MKKISKKKTLLTKTGLGVVAASLVMTPIVTAIACGSDAKPQPKPTPIPEPIKWSEITPATLVNGYKGSFSTPEKQAEFLAITDTIPNGAFQNESQLTSISLPKVITVGENAFAMADTSNLLTEINLPKVETINNNAFSNVNVAAINFPNLTSFGNGLFNQETLKSISLDKLITIESNMFSMQTLNHLSLASAITLKDNSFKRLKTLNETLILPLVETIENGVFQNMRNITKIELPKLNNIGINAFWALNMVSIKINELQVGNTQNGAFGRIKANAEVFVQDISAWENAPQLAGIFGNNFTTIQWRTAS